MSPLPDSYYVATSNAAQEHAALEGDIQADVCVIGGGFTGVSAALNLAERGMKVVLLEAECIGYGASGRNGGLIGSGQRRDPLEVEKTFGHARSKLLWDFAEMAKQEIRDRVAKHDIDCDLQKGQLVGVTKKRYRGWAAEMADALAERYDYPDTHALDVEATRAMVATDTFYEGFFDPNAATIHPLNYVLGLADTATKAGVAIFENSRVTAYTRADPAKVTTEKGSVTANFIVLACNAYLGKLEPRIAGKMMPINNFVIATEQLGEERCNKLISGRYGVHDTRFVVNYFHLSDDHRLLFGGGESYRRKFPADIGAFVRKHMLQVFPQLSDVAIDYAWGGAVAVTVNRWQHVGRLEPNVFFGQGYSGHGIATANFSGKLIAEAVTGTAERFDVFAKLPMRSFPGGTLLRYPGMVLGMLYYVLKDRL